MKSFFELISKRESCRNYSDQKVEKALLEKCLEAARLAPSACNSQPWNFIAITQDEMVKKVAACLQELSMNEFTSKCPAFIVITQGQVELCSKMADKIDQEQFAKIDIGLATAQLCLAATELGLSSCIIGWFNEKKLKKILNIEGERRVRLVICLGYAQEGSEAKAKDRKEMDDIAKFI
ncbi:MAG: NAD(P)H nitroreductase [Clostridiales bacterium]|nr:NAD(P)H nitroreductase [Clostridiales bacterium]